MISEQAKRLQATRAAKDKEEQEEALFMSSEDACPHCATSTIECTTSFFSEVNTYRCTKCGLTRKYSVD